MRRLVGSIARATAMTTTMAMTVLAGAASAGSDEQVLSPDEVPKVVMEVVEGRFGAGLVKGAAREREKGRLVYEVTLEKDGHVIDVTVTPKGRMLLIERAIGAAELPAAVAGAIESAYPGAELRIVEEIVKVTRSSEKLALYEVFLVPSDGHAVEVQVTPHGSIVQREAKDGQNDD